MLGIQVLSALLYFLILILSPPQAIRISLTGEWETQVTGDEAQGTMGRRGRRSDSFPSSLAPKFSSRERERDVWVRGRFPALMRNGELKQRRRRRKRERPKSNWFTESSKTTSLYVHHGFWYISLPSLDEYDVKCLISRFVEDVT